MKPPNGIRITPDELAAIVVARRPDRKCDIPPQAQDFPLPAKSRLWYVAEFIYQARLARRNGNPELERSWRDRAQRVAAAVAHYAAKGGNPDLLRQVADSLDGKHPQEPAETIQQKVLSAINQFCAARVRYPSRRELIELGIRGADITEVNANIIMQGGKRVVRPERRGRKPGN